MKSENKAIKAVKANQGREGLAAALEGVRLERSLKGSAQDRWKRIYRTSGGALVGWLLDEALARQMDLPALARELGVTVGYLSQLHSGLRDPADISPEFAAACGVFLRVPSVVVQVVAGHLTLLDFVCATDVDRWVEDLGVEGAGDDDVDGASARLACGAQLGQKELWLLPRMAQVLTSVASVHQTRARLG